VSTWNRIQIFYRTPWWLVVDWELLVRTITYSRCC